MDRIYTLRDLPHDSQQCSCIQQHRHRRRRNVSSVRSGDRREQPGGVQHGRQRRRYIRHQPWASDIPRIANTILWGNTAATSGDQLYLDPATDSGLSIQYSNVQGGWPGVGNIDEPPMFVDPDGPDDIPGNEADNFRLLPGSPCINTGDPAYLPQPDETDLDGRARILCDRIDMGPYEFGIGDYDCDQAVDRFDFAQ